mmetsp:Transcript_19962/g.76477  ORF Transcript_19962/g.76477 Transcript_19962/m.76477 type:complete len:248 (-) Transcript_19962:103-846(-)
MLREELQADRCVDGVCGVLVLARDAECLQERQAHLELRLLHLEHGLHPVHTLGLQNPLHLARRLGEDSKVAGGSRPLLGVGLAVLDNLEHLYGEVLAGSLGLLLLLALHDALECLLERLVVGLALLQLHEVLECHRELAHLLVGLRPSVGGLHVPWTQLKRCRAVTHCVCVGLELDRARRPVFVVHRRLPSPLLGRLGRLLALCLVCLLLSTLLLAFPFDPCSNRSAVLLRCRTPLLLREQPVASSL